MYSLIFFGVAHVVHGGLLQLIEVQLSGPTNCQEKLIVVEHVDHLSLADFEESLGKSIELFVDAFHQNPANVPLYEESLVTFSHRYIRSVMNQFL